MNGWCLFGNVQSSMGKQVGMEVRHEDFLSIFLPHLARCRRSDKNIQIFKDTFQRKPLRSNALLLSGQTPAPIGCFAISC